jgi:hypothetical protein
MGNCYPTAGRMVIDDPALTLCHGVVTDVDGVVGPHGHAWVERTDRFSVPRGDYPDSRHWVESTVVVDRANGNDVTMPQVLYYKLGRIDPATVVRYAPETARRMMLEHGHWGPWT